jgi:hypothetical protein
MAMEDIADALSMAPALQRAMILDLGTSTPETGVSEFALRGAMEKLVRSRNIYMLASIHPTDRGADTLSKALLAAAPGSTDLIEWFRLAAQQVQGWCSSQPIGFPVFSKERP